MIEFHKPQLTDKPRVDELLRRPDHRGSEYNCTNLFVWCDAYDQRIARVGDFLVTHLCGALGCS